MAGESGTADRESDQEHCGNRRTGIDGLIGGTGCIEQTCGGIDISLMNGGVGAISSSARTRGVIQEDMLSAVGADEELLETRENRCVTMNRGINGGDFESEADISVLNDRLGATSTQGIVQRKDMQGAVESGIHLEIQREAGDKDGRSARTDTKNDTNQFQGINKEDRSCESLSKNEG
jgi:hypothetical protein